jgi:hypothetical protein
MRNLLFAIALVSVSPTMAFAQDWQDWSRQNPTYGSPTPEAVPAPAAPVPTRPAARPPLSAPTRPPLTPGQPAVTLRSPEFVSGFMQGCTEKLGMRQKAYCACAVQKLQDNFTTQEFVQEFEQLQRTGVNQGPLVEKAIRPCLTHIVR